MSESTDADDNYEARLLSELNRLTAEMVGNRRRVRAIMEELAQLWDTLDDDREAIESEQRGRASVFE